MPRRNEEPQWDTESDGASEESSGEESGFENEESDGDSSGSEDGSEEGSSEEDESGSEEGSESGSDEDGSEVSESDESSDDDESSSGNDESMEEVGFGDEEGLAGKGRSDGSLLNEPNTNPKWTKLVPAKIVAMGPSASLLFCSCLILIPLILIIGLSVGLTRDRNEDIDNEKVIDTPPPTPLPSPTKMPTASPTAREVIQAAILDSEVTTTIYRDGLQIEENNGESETMLVQNSPPGDTELPSAYSLVQFDGIVGVDSDSTDANAYLSSIEDLTVELCLTVASAEADVNVIYTTCLLPSDSAPSAVDGLTGVTAPAYKIPDDCLNNQVVTFDVDSSTTEVCVDIASLLTMDVAAVDSTNDMTGLENTEPNPNPSLRGRRRTEDGTNTTNGVDVTYLFMIDTLEESDQSGTRFYSSKDSGGRSPTLSIEGENTCKTAAKIACRKSEFSTLCSLVKQAELENILNSNKQLPYKTIFAPTNDAFERLDDQTLKALQDTSALIEVLQYHIVEEILMSTDLQCSAPIDMVVGSSTTLCGNNGKLYQVGSGVSPGVNAFPEIIATDIETCYGVVHVVDEVLIPADTKTDVTCISDDKNETIADFCAKPDYSTFCTMLNLAGVVDVLSNGLYTIFAPTNSAFEKALAAIGDNMVNTDSLNIDSLNTDDVGMGTSTVLQHVISGSAIYAQDLPCNTEVEMANGMMNVITCEDNGIDGEIFFIGAPGNNFGLMSKIIENDIIGCNFVIHSIDELIFPEDILDSGNSTGDENESCGICGAGMSITLPDATIEIPASVGVPAEGGVVTCKDADALCKAGGCSPDTCSAFLQISQNCGCEESQTVVDFLATEATFSSLLDFAERADLVEDLSDLKDITLFAPNNDAFSALREAVPELVSNLEKEEWKTHLQNILLHHVLNEIVTSSDITNEKTVKALDGEDILFTINKNGKQFVNGAKVEIADLETDNGIIHSIRGVLVPSWVSNSIIDVMEISDDLSAVKTFIDQSNLADTLSGDGPFTVFAPTNAGIQKFVDKGAVDFSDSDVLASVLNYHVVPGIYPYSAISDGLGLTTASGEELMFNLVGDTTATVNGNNIISVNNLANNGIVHIIDGLLVPGLVTVPSGTMSQSCSICTGEEGVFVLTNGEATISIPEGIAIPTIESNEATCTLLEQTCQSGFCNAAACTALAEIGAKEACGCVENEASRKN